MNDPGRGFTIQNPLLGGLLLWRFSSSYFDRTSATEGPLLPKALLVLPILFHRRSVESIYRMNKNSGLVKAIHDNSDILLGLQDRLEAFGAVTFESINLAASASLLRIESDGQQWPMLVPGANSTKGVPKQLAPISDGVKNMVKASERLGPWFAEFEIPSLYSLLKVRL